MCYRIKYWNLKYHNVLKIPKNKDFELIFYLNGVRYTYVIGAFCIELINILYIIIFNLKLSILCWVIFLIKECIFWWIHISYRYQDVYRSFFLTILNIAYSHIIPANYQSLLLIHECQAFSWWTITCLCIYIWARARVHWLDN